MSQLSFSFTSGSKVKTVHLVGTWDGYRGQLPLTSSGSGKWKGTFRFSEKTLKPGSRYWYYVSRRHPHSTSSRRHAQRHQLTITNSTSKTVTNPHTTKHPAVKSSPALAEPSTSSTSLNPPPPRYPPRTPPSPLSVNAPPPTLPTQVVPSPPPKSSTPSPPSRTNPAACARQTTPPLPASTIWPTTSRRRPSTRCATSLRPRPSGPACRHAAQTARRLRHCPVSAIQAPRTRSADASASASLAAAAVSRSIAAGNVAGTRMIARRLVRASIPRARVRARQNTRNAGRGGRKSNLQRIMRPSHDTWR